MKKYLLEFLESGGNLTVQEILLRILVAVAIGFVIYISYWLSHYGSNYSRKFNVTLITLTILTTTVMIVIGNNLALSLGMVGALSIVRFRTAIKDSRDTTYIFWTIIAGICCGAGDYMVAAIGSVVVFVILVILGRIKNDKRLLLIIRTARANEQSVEAAIFTYYNRKASLKVKNTTENSVEFIYEINWKMSDKALKNGKTITDILYEIGNMEYVNLVKQSDEISS